MFIVAGLLDAVAMIGIGFALFFTFANPFLGPLSQAAEPVISQLVEETLVNINLTLIVQMLVFVVLIWFTMKFVWPIILGAMEEREKKIAPGSPRPRRASRSCREAQEPRRRRDHAKRASAPRRSSTGAARGERDRRAGARPRATKASRRSPAAQQQIELESNRARDSLRRRSCSSP